MLEYCRDFLGKRRGDLGHGRGVAKKSPLIFKEYSIQYETNLQLSCSAVGAFAFRKYTYERITEIESRYLKG